MQSKDKEHIVMRIIRIGVGLALATCLVALSATSSAFAAPKWEVCKENAGSGTKYEDSSCTKVSSSGKFEWVEIKAATKVTEEGELEFEDSKTSLGAVRLKCKVVSVGTVGPGAEDTIEKVTTSGCKVVKGTCGSPTVEAIHLPWKTELTEIGGEVRDVLKSGGTGLPGYKSTCTVIIKVTDTCEAETNAGVGYSLTEGFAEVKFDPKSPKATCTQSKEKTGTVEGTLKGTTKGIRAT
jgi:hypothetical protein